jgi:hypothetical protein
LLRLEVTFPGLVCGTEQQKGWYGVRAKNGFIVDGLLKHSIYFEVLVAGTGVSRVIKTIFILIWKIGFSLSGASYNLGTDWKGWGYGGTGKKSHGNNFIDFGEGYRKGDIVGCSLDLVTGNISYFKNGRCMGIAFTVPREYHGYKLFPTVAVRYMKFQLNFGRDGFTYSPVEFMKQGAVKKISKKLIPNPNPRGSYNLDIIIQKSGAVDLLAKSPPKFVSPEKTQKVKIFLHLVTLFKKNEWVPSGPNYFERLPWEVIAIILDYLDIKSLINAGQASFLLRRVKNRYFLAEKRELICFHSKVDFHEDILGVGILADHPKTIKSSGIYAETVLIY